MLLINTYLWWCYVSICCHLTLLISALYYLFLITTYLHLLTRNTTYLYLSFPIIFIYCYIIPFISTCSYSIPHIIPHCHTLPHISTTLTTCIPFIQRFYHVLPALPRLQTVATNSIRVLPLGPTPNILAKGKEDTWLLYSTKISTQVFSITSMHDVSFFYCV